MGERFHAVGVHPVELFHVKQDIIQLRRKFFCFRPREFETGEVRHVLDLFLRYLHKIPQFYRPSPVTLMEFLFPSRVAAYCKAFQYGLS